MRDLILLMEDSSHGTYFHVTFETRVPLIRKQGIMVGKRRNWNNVFGAKQGSRNHIYLFSDETAAVRWAYNMEYEFGRPAGILVINNPPGLIAPDDHIQMQLNNYQAFTTDENIPPECIGEFVLLTDEMKKEVAQTGAISPSYFQS